MSCGDQLELKLGTYKMTRETTAVNLKFLLFFKKKERKKNSQTKLELFNSTFFFFLRKDKLHIHCFFWVFLSMIVF